MSEIAKITAALLACSTLAITALDAATHSVTSASSDPTVAGSLPFFINNSASGDTIDCSMLPGFAIAMTQDFPAINHNLIITSTTPITINGGGLHQPFSVAAGTASITNFNLNMCVSEGGAGGSGLIGGGGGAGGGGGLYVHNGASVSLSNVMFMTNMAVGGAGGAGGAAGAGGGGGGGGYGGGAGGNTAAATGGGGGGGSAGGGAGGTSAAPAGVANTNLTLAGGGGAAATGTGGSSIINLSGVATTNLGGASGAGGGGGGGGIGAAGVGATPTVGGAGGAGLGSDMNFGGGGGGGGAATFSGGAGSGTAGGGGGGNGAAAVGGAGGTAGGGGGGGEMTGGAGGFGAGGGGTVTGMATTSVYGGGAGGAGAAGGGGGGAGLGGAIFIQNGSTLTINDGITFMGNTATGGAGGGGGAAAGLGESNDIFLRSGGSLVFNLNSTNLTIASQINSDQGAGGGTGGGLTMSGTKILFLTNGTNTYSGGTTISSGTLNVSADPSLGRLTDGITINTGTLQAGASFSSPRAITLTGGAIFDTPAGATNLMLSGLISGSGSINKTSPGTLTISGAANNFSGGSTATAGTLSISTPSALGGGTLTVGAATFQITSPITFSNNITLSGAAILDPQGNSVSLNGQISGSGSLTKIGAGIVTLGGANSYTGGTVVNAGVLVGSTASLQGTIQNNAAVQFAQGFSGTYSGGITGNGSLDIFGGTVQFTGNSGTFTGTTTVHSGSFIVNGSLAMSPTVVNAGTVLSGAGTVGTLTNSGTVIPGNGTGTLNVSGNYFANLGSVAQIGISPTGSNLLNITGTANLTNGNLVIVPGSGFYGLTQNYVLVNSASLLGTMFANSSITNPNFVPTVTYTANQVLLYIQVLNPFIDFPFINPNAAAVGNNIGQLNLAGELNADLIAVIDGFAGGSIAAINDALDQMHPAPFSSFAEVQSETGSLLATMFHRRPYMNCNCTGARHYWVQPFADWTRYDHKGEQVAFMSNIKGIAFGVDNEVLDSWVVGLGGAWDQGSIDWHQHRGHADSYAWHAALYSDYQTDNFYIGASVFGGLDTYETRRHLQFFNTDRTATAKFNAVDIVSQLSSAYFFGSPVCHFYPYANLDFLYLNSGSVHEKDAGGLNLEIASNTRSTFRGETGIGLQVQDTNYNNTMCISPLVRLGYIIECPIQRPGYVCNFEGEPLSFTVHGWDYTWQFFTVDFGLSFTYKCVSISGGYTYEISPESHGHEWAISSQKGNFRLDYTW